MYEGPTPRLYIKVVEHNDGEAMKIKARNCLTTSYFVASLAT